ncbi:alpha/beta hydrolase [Flavobacterium sp.]|uniref:alpha/beta fold hydrolase n=1 Tax=Flavobacterium sp. TaxID=239 RepID=UPI00260AFD3F|nr:alpha/beta hydrolase [Flavobacterium sp.]
MENVIEYHTIKIGAINQAFIQAGSGQPLILLHGFPQHSHMWRKIIPELAKHYLVIAPDLRGMGGSSITPDGYEKENLAKDIQALITQLKLENICLVGYDHGGGVAYSLAAQFPELFKKVCFIEYTPPGFGYEYGLKPVPDWQAWQLAFFTVPDVAVQFIIGRERELLSWYFWHWSYNPDAISQEEFEIYVRQLQKPGALKAGFAHFAAVFADKEHFAKTSQTKLKMPVLALGGENGAGEFMLNGWQQLAENVAGGSIKKAGHWIVDEQPAELTKQLLAFFA